MFKREGNKRAVFSFDLNSEEAATDFFNSLLLSDINMNDNLQHDFIYESLIQFDQIIKITTIDVWSFYKNKSKQIHAGDSLKAKMATFETIDATSNTLQAIAKATKNFDDSQNQNLENKLRLSNLEMQFWFSFFFNLKISNHEIGDRQQFGNLPLNPLLAVMMLAVRATPMTTRMRNSDCGCTGLAFEHHVITAFTPATPHRTQGLMVAGQHLMAMGLFQVLLVMINDL